MANIDKLNKLASGKSKWIEEARARQKNKNWLKHSQKIAIKVLATLREKQIRQKELAKMIGVSPQQINKIVKGRENLTLETITKLENTLDLQLIAVGNSSQTIVHEFKTRVKKEYVYLHVYPTKTTVAQKNYQYQDAETLFSENFVSEKMVSYG